MIHFTNTESSNIKIQDKLFIIFFPNQKKKRYEEDLFSDSQINSKTIFVSDCVKYF